VGIQGTSRWVTWRPSHTFISGATGSVSARLADREPDGVVSLAKRILRQVTVEGKPIKVARKTIARPAWRKLYR